MAARLLQRRAASVLSRYSLSSQDRGLEAEDSGRERVIAPVQESLTGQDRKTLRPLTPASVLGSRLDR